MSELQRLRDEVVRLEARLRQAEADNGILLDFVQDVQDERSRHAQQLTCAEEAAERRGAALAQAEVAQLQDTVRASERLLEQTRAAARELGHGLATAVDNAERLTAEVATLRKQLLEAEAAAEQLRHDQHCVARESQLVADNGALRERLAALHVVTRGDDAAGEQLQAELHPAQFRLTGLQAAVMQMVDRLNAALASRMERTADRPPEEQQHVRSSAAACGGGHPGLSMTQVDACVSELADSVGRLIASHQELLAQHEAAGQLALQCGQLQHQISAHVTRAREVTAARDALEHEVQRYEELWRALHTTLSHTHSNSRLGLTQLPPFNPGQEEQVCASAGKTLEHLVRLVTTSADMQRLAPPSPLPAVQQAATAAGRPAAARPVMANLSNFSLNLYASPPDKPATKAVPSTSKSRQRLEADTPVAGHADAVLACRPSPTTSSQCPSSSEPGAGRGGGATREDDALLQTIERELYEGAVRLGLSAASLPSQPRAPSQVARAADVGQRTLSPAFMLRRERRPQPGAAGSTLTCAALLKHDAASRVGEQQGLGEAVGRPHVPDTCPTSDQQLPSSSTSLTSAADVGGAGGPHVIPTATESREEGPTGAAMLRSNLADGTGRLSGSEATDGQHRADQRQGHRDPSAGSPRRRQTAVGDPLPGAAAMAARLQALKQSYGRVRRVSSSCVTVSRDS